jgi:cytidyltransferase-like protein
VSYAFTFASVGGTFNHLHDGHIEYLELAFHLATRVRIYLTSDELAQKAKPYSVRSFDDRKTVLARYLADSGLSDRADIEVLDDLEWRDTSLLLDEKIDVAVVTPEYYEKFLSLAAERAASAPLRLVVKTRTKDADGEISSRRIDRETRMRLRTR